MLTRFVKYRALSGVLGFGLLGSAFGYAAFLAAPKSLQAQGNLSRSERAAFAPGKRFFVTVARGADFPYTLAQLARVRCRFVREGAADVEWPLGAGAYMRHPQRQHATFGFDPVGNRAGAIVITIDDDETAPIPVDPTSLDPCATPAPLPPKSPPSR